MKPVARMFRLNTLAALAALITFSPMTQAALTVTCSGCFPGSWGFATALPAGYDRYEWFVPSPGTAFPAATNTNSTGIFDCPSWGSVWVRALDSAGNLIDTGIVSCGT